MKGLFKFLKDEEGIEIFEWALMVTLFALAMIPIFPILVTALTDFAGKIADILNVLI